MKKSLETTKNMIRLSFGADAYSLGYHWTYNITKNLEQFEKTNFQLIDPMAKKFHPERKAGDLSAYGDQELALLESLTEGKRFNKTRFISIWENIWRVGYNDWIDNATKIRLASNHGSNSNDLNPVSRIAPLFLIENMNLNEMKEVVEEFIGITHNNLEVKDFGKFIVHLLSEVQSGGEIKKSIEKIKDEYPFCKEYIERGLEYCNYTWKELMEKEIPTYCEIDGSGPLTIYLLCTFWDSPKDMFAYNVVFDGDTCGRSGILALFVGMTREFPLFADEWYEKLCKREKIEELLEKF
ncbi:MAG: ADP-ribosylglycohydrolase family protein [Cetobacterium sp.]|nr:ADP-ribosylglycohydrolase family protein [Cetobacterium sp.]